MKMQHETDGRPYFAAYDDRYRQVHALGLQWFSDAPTPIVAETLRAFRVPKTAKLLEIGCGEGRDAAPLLLAGYDLLVTDLSPEAVAFCQKKYPQYADRFRIADCVRGTLEGEFDFVYAVAVLHMLVSDGDRRAFYRFMKDHLAPGGIALLCTMGDGTFARQSDVRTAFDLTERVHEATGRRVRIAGTSCRIVDFSAFALELRESGLAVLQKGVTAAPPDFSDLMYAVVRASA